MAYHVEIMPRAERDMDEIHGYINAGSSQAAARWFKGLGKVILSLAEHPERGRITPESTKLRQVLYGRKPHVYRIIYSIDIKNSTASVLHIRHGARDIALAATITKA